MPALVEAGTPVVVDLRQDAGTCTSRRALGITLEENLDAHRRDRARTSRTTARKWSTTPSTSSTATRPIPTTRCARSKPRTRRAPTCSASATPTAARSTDRARRDRRRRAPAASTASSASTRTTIPTSAVANALAAVEAGATHVQGCMNGYGERCGNANLASIIANLELKLGHTTIGPREAREPHAGVHVHRRAGQPAAAQRSAVRRQERLRAQGRRARQRRAQGLRHLRAHRRPSWSATASACS